MVALLVGRPVGIGPVVPPPTSAARPEELVCAGLGVLVGLVVAPRQPALVPAARQVHALPAPDGAGVRVAAPLAHAVLGGVVLLDRLCLVGTVHGGAVLASPHVSLVVPRVGALATHQVRAVVAVRPAAAPLPRPGAKGPARPGLRPTTLRRMVDWVGGP